MIKEEKGGKQAERAIPVICLPILTLLHIIRLALTVIGNVI